MRLSPAQIQTFQETIWDYYARSGRKLPWREPEPDGRYDPYKILVSEMMLQQTQVTRVIPKFNQFIAALPTCRDLADAPLSLVLTLWSGLGYNRRAKYLHEAARTIVHDYDNRWPTAREQLVLLPGIGSNTAGAILAYAFNQPELFIETNIRSVYIYHFLRDETLVKDATVRELLNDTLDRNNARNFYWALMDYGSYLKATVGNPNRISQHYSRQPAFSGSLRQLRGQVVRLLTERAYSSEDLSKAIADERLPLVLAALSREGLIMQRHNRYRLA